MLPPKGTNSSGTMSGVCVPLVSATPRSSSDCSPCELAARHFVCDLVMSGGTGRIVAPSPCRNAINTFLRRSSKCSTFAQL